MADFTDDLRNEDPMLLHRLRTMLGSGKAPRPLPTCEDRFGVPASGRTRGGETPDRGEPVLVGHPLPRLRGHLQD